MTKIIITVAAVIVLVVGGFFAFNAYIYEQKQAPAAGDYKDAEYFVGGERVQLTDGVSEVEAAPGSASKIVTRYFGNELRLDADQDGREDVVFLLTQETGGSGVFYYVVAALDTERGYVGSEGLLLGDRIAPQTTEKGAGSIVIVNYADRAPGESFAVAPSVGKTIWLKLDPQSRQFGEVEQNFEGEANPATMKLDMKPWVWISALYNDGREVMPKEKDAFKITFGKDGAFSATTDCNQMGGKYTAKDGQISFTNMFATKMFCQDSQEQTFSELLRDSSSYHFTSRGELILDLKFDSGSVVFR